MKEFESFMEEYFETRPEFLEEIKFFEQRRGFRLLKKLTKDKDEINFFSWLSEVRFGLLFDNISSDLKNDHPIEGKTPDWTVTLNDQKIIAEVLRLNTPEEEHRQTIQFNRELRKYQKESPGVPIATQGPVKVITLEHLGGCQSKLMKKEEKYSELIHKQKLPFIICVAPTIDTFLFELDFSDFLMGSRGFFKRNENFRRSVTGVLLNVPFGNFFYYHNEDAEHQLSKENLGVFLPLFYS